MPTEPTPEVVELVFPASTRFVRLSRLAAATLASELGFDLEEVDDVRIAVDELVTFLVDGGHGGQASLRFVLGPELLTVEGRCDGPTVTDAALSDLVEAIVSATTDEYVTDSAAGSRSFRITKRRRGGTATGPDGPGSDGAGAGVV